MFGIDFMIHRLERKEKNKIIYSSNLESAGSDLEQAAAVSTEEGAHVQCGQGSATEPGRITC